MSEDLDVSMNCVQYMLFVSNFLFVIVSMLLISIGTIIKAMYTDFEYFLESSYFSPSDLIIFSGFVVFFVAFFGCWGAIRQSTLLVNVYALLLLIILVLEVLAAVFALSMRIDLKSTISKNMNATFHKRNESKDVQDVFDFTQSQLLCCGVYGPSDYNRSYPPSCCEGYPGLENNQTCQNPYSTPCLDQVTELVSQTAYLLTSGALCVSFIQVIGIIFARLLSKTIRNLKTQRLVEAELRRQKIYSQIILGASIDGDNRPHTTTASEA